MGSGAAAAVVGELCMHHCRLLLGGNFIGDAGASSLGLAMSGLSVLDISSNMFGDSGMTAIATGLASSRNMVSINVAHNLISDGTCGLRTLCCASCDACP